MAELGDYLGHILCEVTRARVSADLEALRVAKEYVADEKKLLRYFPVPRMRLPTLEITVPVQINDVPDGYIEKTSAEPSLLAKVLADELVPALREHSLRITTADITKIIKSDPNLAIGVLLDDLSDSLSIKLYNQLKPYQKTKKGDGIPESKLSAGETFKLISNMIKEKVKTALAALPRQPVGITVEPRTSVIREVGNPSLLLNVKLVVSEDALEIHLEEDNEGKATPPQIKRLIPE